MYHLGPYLFNRYKSKLLVILTILFAISFLFGGYLVYNSPNDYLQGEYVKIMYIHVPSAWLAMLLYSVIAGTGGLYLVFKNPFYFVIGKAVAPVGGTFALITLITGAIWGHPTWGTWWVWDARLTSMLILFFIYLGCISLQRSLDNDERAAMVSSVFAIIGFINIPIIKFSVNIWNTLHQPASVFRLDGSSIHNDMLVPLLIFALSLLFFACSLIIIRIHNEVLSSKIARLQYFRQNEKMQKL